jgi:hypothetical protein
MDGTHTRRPPEDPPEATGPGGRRRLGLWLGGLVVVTMLGMWAYIFVYHASGAWRSETPGRMDDASYGASAELACQAAQRRTAALPEAFEAATAAERADVVAAVNTELAVLVDELDALEVTPGAEGSAADRTMADEWVADWRTYLDRRDYVERLRDDPRARFYVTQSDRDEVQITEAIDRFAAVNQMPSCITPDDLS